MELELLVSVPIDETETQIRALYGYVVFYGDADLAYVALSLS